jgi:hypothetical protein
VELRDLWRIIKRRRRFVYWAVAIITLYSVVTTALSIYQGLNVTLMSIEVNQAAPQPADLAQQVRNLNSIPWDPIQQALDRSVGVANIAFTATDRRGFFDTMHDTLKKKYHINKTWQDIQGMLDVYPAARNHIYFKASGSPLEVDLDRDLVISAAQWVLDYINRVYPTLYPSQPAPHAFVFDPVNLQHKATHITAQLNGLLTRIAGGVVLGLVLGFLWEYLDEYAHDERDVELLLGTRALAVIPVHEAGSGQMA